MADKSMNIPSGMGGLVRFKEEYASRFKLKPVHVVIFVILIIVFRVLLGIFLK